MSSIWILPKYVDECDVLRLKPYYVPNPYNLLEDAIRYHHEDLPGMDDDELACERFRIQFVLAFCDVSHRRSGYAWIRERSKAVAEEVARRGNRHLGKASRNTRR